MGLIVRELETQMMRTVGTVAILLGFGAWLFASYSPTAAAMLPVIAFDGAWSATWLPALAAAALAVCVAIQGWLIYATANSLRKPQDAVQAAALQHFGLNVGVEALWTAAPLAITIALAAWLWIGRG
jgi:heme/copper-type cytochrome/quinol oxidase subunit 2